MLSLSCWHDACLWQAGAALEQPLGPAQLLQRLHQQFHKQRWHDSDCLPIAVLAGARPDEAVSWGKIRADAQPVKVYGDASIIFPLILSQTFARHWEKEPGAAQADEQAAERPADQAVDGSGGPTAQ
jgi:hypothetical protein